MTSASQYRVIAKKTAPVSMPRPSSRRAGAGREVAVWAVATISGATATQASAGLPNFGKLKPSSRPARMASA
jgi:hypothetical protein